MLKINDTTITMTRGDTARIEVQMQYENDIPYEAYYGDVIRFTVKKNYDDYRPLIVKDVMVNGDIDTFIDRGTLILTEEVGRYTDSGLNGGIVG